MTTSTLRTVPLGDLVDERAAATPHATAMVFPHERVTFAELAERSDDRARALLGLGARPGDTVGILMPSVVDFVALMLGAAKLGVIPVLMNARFKARELRHVIGNGDLTMVLTSSSVADAVDFPALLLEAVPDAAGAAVGTQPAEGLPHLRHLVLVDDEARPGFIGAADVEAAAATVGLDEVRALQRDVQVEDVGLIMYTSGTTASPKGAMLCHDALVRQGHLVAETRFHLTPDDVVWTPLPLFHIGGMGHVLTGLVAGCTLVHCGHFDVEVAMRQLVDEACTVAVPAFETMWLQVLDHADFSEEALHRLRLVLAVGIPERLRSMQDRLPDAPMVTTFGGTESTSHLSIALADDPPATRLTTGGHPLPGIEVRIVDPETGEDAATGQQGEIVYRGWNRFLGYYNEPELTAEVIDDEGWFHSGDVGTLDADGRVSYVGRIKDMLKVGGENVAAAEIEGFLVDHPAVQIVQVVSAPDARYTEVPAAYVQLKVGAEATEQELIDHCRGRIATFKVPRYVRFVEEWPMSGTKIKKFELRERIAAELSAAGITEAPKVTS